MVDFYHNREIDMLMLECTLPNLAKICLHKSTTANFYRFKEGDKDLFKKIGGDMVREPSFVFSSKALVNETLIRDSTN